MRSTFNVGSDRVVAGDSRVRMIAVAPQHIVLGVDTQPSPTQLLLIVTIKPGEKGGERREEIGV